MHIERIEVYFRGGLVGVDQESLKRTGITVILQCGTAPRGNRPQDTRSLQARRRRESWTAETDFQLLTSAQTVSLESSPVMAIEKADSDFCDVLGVLLMLKL